MAETVVSDPTTTNADVSANQQHDEAQMVSDVPVAESASCATSCVTACKTPISSSSTSASETQDVPGTSSDNVIEIRDNAEDTDGTNAVTISNDNTQNGEIPQTTESASTKQSDEDSKAKQTTKTKSNFSLPLLCASCETAFSDKTPKLLPCLHSICTDCVEKFETNATDAENRTDSNQKQNSQTIICPVCEKYSNIKDISDNYLVLEHLPVSDSSQHRPSKCTGCEDSQDPTSFCSECAEWLCDQCVQAHHRVKITKDHKITPLFEIDSSKNVSTVKNKDVFNCQIHPHECLRLYCEKCSVVTCRECQLFVHKEHKFSYLHEVGGNLRDIFKTLITRAQFKKAQVLKGIENCDEWRKKIASTEDELKAEIKATINKVVTELIRYGREREERLAKICNKLRNELDSKKIKIQKGLKEINTSLNFFQYITENSSDCALVKSKPVLTNNFKSIFTSNISEYANIQWNLNLKYIHNVNEFLQHKNLLGDLLMEAPNGKVECVRQNSPTSSSPPTSKHVSDRGEDRGLDSLSRIAKYSGTLTSEQRAVLMKKWAERHAISGVRANNSSANIAQQPSLQTTVSMGQISAANIPVAQHNVRTAGTFVPMNPFSQPLTHGNVHVNRYPSRFQQPSNTQGPASMFLPHRPAMNQNASNTGTQNLLVVNQPTDNTPNSAIAVSIGQQNSPHVGGFPVNHPSFSRPPPPFGNSTTPPRTTRTPPPLGRRSVSPSTQSVANQRPSSANSIPSTSQLSSRSIDSSPTASDGIPASAVKNEKKSTGNACSRGIDKNHTPPPSSVPAPPSINPKLSDAILLIPSITNSPPPPQIESDQLQMSRSYAVPVQNVTDPYQLLAGLEDPSEDYCACCHNGGDLLCCDQCPKVYHYTCHIPPLTGPPSGEWLCTLCKYKQLKMETPEPINFIPGTNKRKAPTGLSDTEIKICEKILLELYCHEASVPFHDPVPKTVPNYYKVITHPTDLSTIKLKLSRNHFNHFASMEDFLSEIKLLISNCALFNAPNSEVGKAGIFIASFFEKLIEKVVPCYLDFVKREVTTHQESSDGSSKSSRKERRRIRQIVDDDDDSEDETDFSSIINIE